MKDIAIFGAGGFGREIKLLLEDINIQKPEYHIIGFYDDGIEKGKIINGLTVLGNIDDLNKVQKPLCIALGIGIPAIKENVISNISNKNISFPVIKHPTVIVGRDDVYIGEGTIICAGSVITCNIKIGRFSTINLLCTVGHDTSIEDFSSLMPSVNISGEVKIHRGVYVGTGAKVINQLEIGKYTVIGAGAVVSKSLPSRCTAVGIPAKPIKFHK